MCAAVSALALNAVNSIEAFADEDYELETADDGGYLKAVFPNGANAKTSLLMDSLVLGIRSIRQEYGNEYINLTFKEV